MANAIMMTLGSTDPARAIGLGLRRQISSLSSPRAIRVSGLSARCRVFENTILGISFIGRANSLSDVGQCAAASAPASDRPAPLLIDLD